MGGRGHGGHTIVAHEGQQQGRVPRPYMTEGTRGDAETQTHTRSVHHITRGVQ